MAAELTKEQMEILDHTLHRAAYGLYCGGGEVMNTLVASGLMTSAGHKSFVPDEYFRITEAGRTALIAAKARRKNIQSGLTSAATKLNL